MEIWKPNPYGSACEDEDGAADLGRDANVRE
jgi:hypothetical protein